MDNINFDRRIKGLADSCQEPVGEDLWGGIEKGLVRRSNMKWVRRVSYAAVAASLVVGLVLNFGGADTVVDNMTALRVISPEKIEIEEGVLPRLAQLKVSGRPQIARLYVDEASANQKSVAVDGDKAAVQEETRDDMIAQEAAAEQVIGAKNGGSAGNEAVEQTLDMYPHEDWMLEEQGEERGLVLGLSSNMLAIGGNGYPSGSPQYMPGNSMSVQNGIIPITEPTFAIPLTVGLQVHFPIGKRLAIGTGLNYTYLKNSFQALIDNSVQGLVDQKLHYIGLPLSLFVNILSNDHFACYVSAGGAVEKGLRVSSRIKDILDGVTYRKEGIKGVQWSVNLGVGIQYSFNELVGIYFDPSLVYFFDTKQPFSVRTSQPLQLDMELGLRFNL